MKIGISFGGCRRAIAAVATMAAIFAAAPAARADTLHASDDAFVSLHPDFAGTTYGGNGSLEVALWGNPRYSFLRFDLSALPAGAVIERAWLRLFVTSVPAPGDIDVYLVDETWDEDSIDGINTPFIGTWIRSFSIAAGDAEDYVTVPLTLEVQDWLDGTMANFGVVLVPSINSPGSVIFDSTENTLTSHQPELEVRMQTNDAVVYTRWGRPDCPASSTLVYEGVVGGKHNTHQGSGTNLLCLSKQPTYNNPTNDSNVDSALIYGTEYETAQQFLAPTSGLQDDNVPCAVCLRDQAEVVLMQPGRETCPATFSLEYDGYLMGAYYTHRSTQFVCVDAAPQGTGATANENPALLYHAEGQCNGTLPCAAGEYVHNREITCSVCTR